MSGRKVAASRAARGHRPNSSSPAFLPAIPPTPAVAVAVPQRNESLAPSTSRDARAAPPVASHVSSACSSSSSLMSQVTSSNVLSSIDAVSQMEGLIDDPKVTYTFEAHTLWRDSFRVLHEFYQEGVLCDVEIHCGGKSIKCHRLVLACISRYFKTMFTSHMAESKLPSVTIKDIDETALESLINFAYTAKITLDIDNVQSMLYASSILQVESVANACCEFMKTHLHPSNCIGIRTFAELHGRSELIHKAYQFTLDHFVGVTECEEYCTMSPKHIESLVASQDLNVVCERQVYEAVVRWVKHDVGDRRQYLSKLISSVKLALLPATYLLETVCNEDLLRTDMECRDHLDEAKHYQLSLAHVVPDMKLSRRLLPRKSCAGVVFCVGGRGASGDPFKSIECYDLRQDRWFQVADMSTRRRHVGVVSVNGRLYAVGGHDGAEHLNSGEVFNPHTNKWKPMNSMASQRRGIALACLGGPIYAIGGLDDSTCFNIVERYDPESDSWSFVQAMNFPRGGVAVAALKTKTNLQGHLYAIGGNDGAISLDSCERYDPHLNKWTLIAPMHKRRAGAGVAELNGKLYVVGGFDDNSPLDSVEVYDPVTNKWELVAGMSCPRGGVGVAPLTGKIYAVGGHDGSSYLKTVEAYDPLENSWALISSISLCRAGAGIAVVTCHLSDLRDVAKVNNLSATAGRL